jgi:thiamine biosynthesis lipoprotein
MFGNEVASFPVWGTTAVVVTADPARLVTAVLEIERELSDIDRTCSRFRSDSDLSQVNENSGSWTTVDPLLLSALEIALHGAIISGGIVDPTVGGAMKRIGYDRDFSEIDSSGPALPPAQAAPGWRLVDVDIEGSSVRVPNGESLDLGATAKAFAADRGAARAAAVAGCGVMLSLGGDVATAGLAPDGGWTIGIADDHRAEPEPGESVAIAGGAIATSSVTLRRWIRGDVPVHHIIDPRTGAPAREIWRTVSVAAGNCVDANIASTAAIVMGEAAPEWLESNALPARLVPANALTRSEVIKVGAWPERVSA